MAPTKRFRQSTLVGVSIKELKREADQTTVSLEIRYFRKELPNDLIGFIVDNSGQPTALTHQEIPA